MSADNRLATRVDSFENTRQRCCGFGVRIARNRSVLQTESPSEVRACVCVCVCVCARILNAPRDDCLTDERVTHARCRTSVEENG